MKKKLYLLISAGVLVIVAIAAVMLVNLSRTDRDETVESIVTRVGRHYLLPDDETPALLTVTDVTKPQSEFLRSAQNGDKMLVYKNHKKVILYRPSADRVVEVGPVSIADTE